MLEEKLIQASAENGRLPASRGSLPLDEATRLLSMLREVKMVDVAITPPREWILWREIPVEALANMVQQHLSRSGWHVLVKAMRDYNRCNPEKPMHLSEALDFLTAVDCSGRVQRR